MYNQITTFIALVLLCTCFASCNSDSEGSTSKSKTGDSKTSSTKYTPFSRYFEREEAIELAKILKFFDEEVCISEDLPRSDVEKCYKAYMKRLLEESKTGNINFNIPMDRQNRLLAGIDKDVIDNIWREGFMMYKREQEIEGKVIEFPDTLSVLHLNKKGTYLYFLKQMGQKDKLVQQLHASIEKGLVPSGFMFKKLLAQYKAIKFKDPEIRLVLAIHFMAYNDQADIMRKSDEKLAKKLGR